MLKFDHIILGVHDLDEGRERLAAVLGTPPSAGGAHEGRGVRNALWRMGDVFLQLIAPCKDSASPPVTFGLSDPSFLARLSEGPAIVGWAARCADIEAARKAAPFETRAVERVRRGDDYCDIAVAPDGFGPYGGVGPLLIQWPEGHHVCETVPDSGLRLSRMVAHGARARDLGLAIGAMGGIDRLEIETVAPHGLSCVIEAPQGVVLLTSAALLGG